MRYFIWFQRGSAFFSGPLRGVVDDLRHHYSGPGKRKKKKAQSSNALTRKPAEIDLGMSGPINHSEENHLSRVAALAGGSSQFLS